MKIKKLFLLLILSLMLLPTIPVIAESPTASDIAQQLICQCGCNTMLSNCVHGECAVRDSMLTIIESGLAQGQSEAEIIRFFVSQDGEQVLASPPKKGFNLVAWILPFVAILAGGGVIYLALKRWVGQGTAGQNTAVTEVNKNDEKYRSQLKRELSEFRGRGFR